MAKKTIVLSEEQITYFVGKNNKAHTIRTDSLNFKRIRKNPAFKALNDVEQSIYLMFLGGMKHKDIAVEVGLTRCQVTRLLNIVKGKIRYLLHFKEVLDEEPEYKKKFLGSESEVL